MTAPAQIETPGQIEVKPQTDVWAVLHAVQAELVSLPKDKVNPYHGSRYTGLDTLTETTRPIFQRYGLVWSTFPTHIEGEPALGYALRHIASGTHIDGVMALVLANQNPQGQGSAITYARRYALTAVLDLVGEDDDDGAVGSDAQPQASENTVNLQQEAKGLRNEAINQALQRVGLPPQERPWGLLGRIPADQADALREGLKLQRQMA